MKGAEAPRLSKVTARLGLKPRLGLPHCTKSGLGLHPATAEAIPGATDKAIDPPVSRQSEVADSVEACHSAVFPGANQCHKLHGVILARWLWSWSEQLQHCQHSKECKQHRPLLSQHFDLVGLTVSQFHCGRDDLSFRSALVDVHLSMCGGGF